MLLRLVFVYVLSVVVLVLSDLRMVFALLIRTSRAHAVEVAVLSSSRDFSSFSELESRRRLVALRSLSRVLVLDSSEFSGQVSGWWWNGAGAGFADRRGVVWMSFVWVVLWVVVAWVVLWGSDGDWCYWWYCLFGCCCWHWCCCCCCCGGMLGGSDL